MAHDAAEATREPDTSGRKPQRVTRAQRVRRELRLLQQMVLKRPANHIRSRRSANLLHCVLPVVLVRGAHDLRRTGLPVVIRGLLDRRSRGRGYGSNRSEAGAAPRPGVSSGSANYRERRESAVTGGQSKRLNEAPRAPTGTLPRGLPCRRPWVRVPSSASSSQKPRNTRQTRALSIGARNRIQSGCGLPAGAAGGLVPRQAGCDRSDERAESCRGCGVASTRTWPLKKSAGQPAYWSP